MELCGGVLLQSQQHSQDRIIVCLDNKQRLFKLNQQLLLAWGLAIATTLIVVFTQFQSGVTKQPLDFHRALIEVTPTSLPPALLPTLQPHPLPPPLAQWQDANNSGDYFSQIKPTKVGYLVWSTFPIKIYIEQPTVVSGTDKAQTWATAVLNAVEEWKVYLSIVVVNQPEAADISIRRSAPPLRYNPTGDIARARSAETRYELYIRQTPPSSNVLYFRCGIWLNPNQTSMYIQAAARHELGHALGLWGHSLEATDALYFSQVRNPPPISSRDINTLKRIYQQPTSLGWSLNH